MGLLCCWHANNGGLVELVAEIQPYFSLFIHEYCCLGCLELDPSINFSKEEEEEEEEALGAAIQVLAKVCTSSAMTRFICQINVALNET
ncbi:hypothetical protein T4E_10142 [Trichinella pseudospiralis]|uniref:Uncharacterized protein n=1 Tax=Trichinella pseudospiralis TaxID=6337 RepID=A0A0V0Y5C5_TRIPS|nr:hypothetical protein T4E_11883 [Trichinella pseudospiralis]KRX95455.1 hypothetical protein T4E_10142 [Trichinella pseudospiralis]